MLTGRYNNTTNMPVGPHSNIANGLARSGLVIKMITLDLTIQTNEKRGSTKLFLLTSLSGCISV